MDLIKPAVCSLILVLMLTACGGDNGELASPTPIPPTLVPTSTSTSLPSDTPVPPPTDFLTPTAVIVETPEVTPELQLRAWLELEEGQEIEPPVNVALPDGWRHAYSVHLYREIDGSLQLLPFAVYSGPVTGGTGYIMLLWAFENIVQFNPVTGQPSATNLHADGLRLLRLAVLEPGCIIGTDLERAFTVGGQPATGTFFNTTGCVETVNTRGWFAVLQQDNVNFAFYVYTEPLDAMSGIAMAELQDILDTVTFHVQEMIEAARSAAP